MNKTMKSNYRILFFLLNLFLIFFLFCDKYPFQNEKESTLPGNNPPETYLFLFPMKDTPTDQTTEADTIGIDTTGAPFTERARLSR